MARRQTPQNLIASLMMEEVGMTSHMSGASAAKATMELPSHEDDISIIAIQTGDEETGNEHDGFTAKELKIAKRFIELMGGADRAREVLDKCDECLDCLDLVDEDQPADDEDMDTTIIAKMAELIPNSPDLPTGNKTPIDVSTLYNPSAISGAM